MSPRDLLGSYSLVVTIALLLGLLTGGFPAYASEITIGSLAVMMTLSLSNVTIGRESLRGIARPTLMSVILNYLLLTGLLLGIALFFTDDLRTGWILMAAVPSAVAVVPFAYMLGGDTRLALMGTTAIYLLSLVLAPLLTLIFIGQEIDRERLITTIVLMILIPIGVSQLKPLRLLRQSVKNPFINICFGVLVFAMTGANRGAFTEDPSMVAWVSLASLIRTFGIGIAILGILMLLKNQMARGKVYVLFGSYKNLGLTAAVAMALVSSEAAIPATICIPFEIFWLVFLKWLLERKKLDVAVAPS